MVNKSGRIGREGENAVAAYLRQTGAFPQAEPRVLYGAHDRGDLTGVGAFAFQVKSGKAAENASQAQIRQWFHDAEEQRENAQAAVAVLVVKRAGYGSKRAGMWRSFVALDTLAAWFSGSMSNLSAFLAAEAVEMEFSMLVDLMQVTGRAGQPFSNNEE
jgi:hypothetical protein